MNRTLLLSVLVVLPWILSSQERLHVHSSCNFSGDLDTTQLYGFTSDQEAELALQRIMKYTGLPSNFTIQAANVPNAAAVIQGKDRYILYNQYFMLRIRDATNTDWSAVSILAHEIGHHLAGHTLEESGSRPEKELEADRFSGFVLYRMGAGLEEALVAVERLATEVGTHTHPSKSARRAAITNGWLSAKELAEQDLASSPEAPNDISKGSAPSNLASNASIHNLWTEYDQFEYEKRGIRLHLNFNVQNLKGEVCRAVAWFYDAEGKPLRDQNGAFASATGQVTTGVEFFPKYVSTNYQDLSLFIPYEELHLPDGKHTLRYRVALFHEGPNGYQQVGPPSEISTIEYSAGPPAPVSSIRNTFVEHEAYQMGNKGLRVHLSFLAQNLKGKPCRAVVWFFHQDGSPLIDSNGEYVTMQGEVSTSTPFRPLYEEAEYDDFSVFLPYQELHLLPGNYTLKYKVGLYYDSPSGFQQIGPKTDFQTFIYNKR